MSLLMIGAATPHFFIINAGNSGFMKKIEKKS